MRQLLIFYLADGLVMSNEIEVQGVKTLQNQLEIRQYTLLIYTVI